jgi:hypothetical protein
VACPAPFEKIFCFSEITNHPITPAVHPTEGRIAIVTDAGLDVMDAGCASDESADLRTAKACGPDTSVLVSSWREENFSLMTVARKPITGEITL